MTVDPLSLALTIGLSALSTAINMSRRIEGPRLSDRRFAGGDYGTAWSRVYGKKWISPPAIWARDLEEVRHEQKTKGGKMTNYDYFAYWAVGLTCHPLDAVSRIKMDGNLVYDMTGTGPVTPFVFVPDGQGKGALPGHGVITDYLAFYNGSMDQDPDPVIMADIEEKYGEGFCPAYRGRSYLRFARLPVQKFGNRFPVVQVEVVRNASTIIPVSSKSVEVRPSAVFAIAFSPDFLRLAWINGNDYEIWDVAASVPMISGSFGGGGVPSTSHVGVFDNGTMLFGDGDNVYSITPEGAVNLYADTTNAAGVQVLGDGDGVEHWGTIPNSFYSDCWFDGAFVAVSGQPSMFFRDHYGNIWLISAVVTGSTSCFFRRMYTFDNSPGWPETFTATMPDSANLGYATEAGETAFLVCWNGKLYLIDPATAAVTGPTATGIDQHDGSYASWAYRSAGSTTIWIGNKEINVATGTVKRTIGSIPASQLYDTIYDPIHHAIIGHDNSLYQLDWYYLDRVSDGGMTHADVVQDVCGVAGIDSDAIITTACTSPVPGYGVSTGTGKDWLDPLNDLFDVDPRPHGFLLEFLPRGGSATSTLDSEDFALPGEGEALFSTKDAGGTDVPAVVTLQFSDTAIEQQPNSALAPPLFDGESKGTLSLDMLPLALDVDTARQLVARYHRRKRFDAWGRTFSLPASEVELEPADVKTLLLSGTSQIARLVSMVVGADRRIATEWRRDDASVTVLDATTTGAAADGVTPATITVAGISKGFVPDVPLLQDSDNSVNPVLYAGASAYAAGAWPGASIYEAVDGSYSDEVAAIAASDEAIWGHSSDALGDVATPWCWDRGNTINVVMQIGSLAGCTEADINANPLRNLCLIGAPGRWEALQFTAATLEMDGSYTLSGLRRGRRGTEGHCSDHAVRDVFVLAASLQTFQLGLSDVGTDLSFKPGTFGGSQAGAFPIDLAPYSGASLKPYAPVVWAVKQGNGDWLIYARWRTRVGGDFRSGVAPSSAEASIAFEFDLGNGTTTVTKSASSSPYTWTQAQQVTDMGAEVMDGHLTCHAFQISAAVGRGFESAIAA